MFPLVSGLQDCVCLPGSEGLVATECTACEPGHTQVEHAFNVSCAIAPANFYAPRTDQAPIACPSRSTPATSRDNSKYYNNCGNKRAVYRIHSGTSPPFARTYGNIAYQGYQRSIGRLDFHPSEGSCRAPGFTRVIGDSTAPVGSYQDGVGLSVHFVTSAPVPSCDIEADGAWVCYLIELGRLRQINMETMAVTTVQTAVPVPASGYIKRVQKTEWVAFRGSDNQMYFIYLSTGWVQKLGLEVTTSYWTASAFAIYWITGNNMYHYRLDTGVSEHLRGLSSSGWGGPNSVPDVDPDGNWVFYTYAWHVGANQVWPHPQPVRSAQPVRRVECAD